MFAIKIDTGFLDMGSKVKATFQLNNPALSKGDDVGLAVMPFTFPDTENNRKKLGFLNLPNVYRKVREYNAELYYNGLRFAIGKLVITEANDTPGAGTYEAVMSINGFTAEVLDKSLRDFNWPSFILGTTSLHVIAHANSKLAADPDNIYCFAPFKQQNFYGNSNLDFYKANAPVSQRGGVVNGWDFATQSFKRNVMPNAPEDDLSIRFNRQTLVPYVYLHYIMRVVFGELGYNLKGEFMEDADLAKLVVFNAFALDKKSGIDYYVKKYVYSQNYEIQEVGAILDPAPDTDLIFASTVVAFAGGVDSYGVYNDGLHEYSAIVNDRFSCTWNVSINFPTPELAAHLGIFIFLVDTFGNIVNMYARTDLMADDFNPLPVTFTNTFEIDNFSYLGYRLKVLIQTDDSWTDFTSEITADIEFKAINYPNLNIYATEIAVKNHIPDVKVTDLLEVLRQFFTLTFDFDFNAKACTINMSKNTLGKYGVKHLTEKATRRHLIRFNEATGYTMSFPFDNEEFQPDSAPDLSDYNYRGEFPNIAAIEALPSPQVNDIAVNAGINWVFKCSFDPNTNTNVWSLFTQNYYPYTVGKNPEEKKPAASPMLMDYLSISGHVYFLPVTSESGTSTAFNIGDNANGLKLGFYEGLQEDSLGDTYPMLTSLSRKTDGTPIGAYSLRWDEPSRGLYPVFLRSWHVFLANTEECETDLILTLPELSAFNFSTPIEIKGVHYIVGQLTGDLSNQGLTNPKSLIYRIML